MYFVKNPHIIKWLYPSMTWEIPVQDNSVFLTFDDGPDPGVTPQVLDLLKKYEAKATFFCVGQNVEKYPVLYERLIFEGHTTGNHSHSHLKGSKTDTAHYLEDIQKAARVIKSKLFRPPYGKIRAEQVKALKNKYKIVMWNVLAGDFDKAVSMEEVLKRLIDHTKPGRIIVLHDNAKFRATMLPALESYLDHCTRKGFKFLAIREEML
jgi:peptidoglycan/xylan/chitin deacetylase (PgdA/CDA1 family)